MPVDMKTESAEPRRAVTELSVSGMTCGNCARHVTDAIQRVPGVQSAAVDLQAGRASVRWTTGARPDAPAVVRAVEAEGYGATAIEPHEPHHDSGGGTMNGWQAGA